MKINSIRIENFQLFSAAEFDFDPHVNLVVGANGSGKTSLLRALAVALGGWAHAYIDDERNHRQILDSEVRESPREGRYEKVWPVRIAATGEASIIDPQGEEKNGFVSWTRSRAKESERTKIAANIVYEKFPKNYPLSFATLGSDAIKYIDSGHDFTFPLFAFYECDRIWKAQESISPETSATLRYSRFDAYRDCFHTGANHRALGEWLVKHELASLQKKHDTPVLQSIRNAARAALEGCTGLRFDFEDSRVMVEYGAAPSVPFEHLSDGQRTMLGLFCDLARRAAILNPHLAGDACAQTPGVVLIDELDLHLHPRWQRAIIASLRKIFPRMQFICTTHSPFLIQSLHGGKLIPLGKLEETDAVGTEYEKLSIEDIVELIQGVEMPQRSQRWMAMTKAAEQYYTLLRAARPSDAETLAALKQKLDALIEPFSDDPAYQAFLRMERLAALGEAGL
ncbi:AAA family ATPase [Massilia sp. W12]|uniref:AAA family ATPase n=1 Tax=Massilia sp. W12 TaxID=3126507 RepID=UPI0030D54CB2